MGERRVNADNDDLGESELVICVLYSITVLSVPKAALAAFCCQQVALSECFEQFLFFHCNLRFLKKEGEKEEAKGKERRRERDKEDGGVSLGC